MILEPKILRQLAQKNRAEASEIQKGQISHFAVEAVFDCLSLAEKYEKDAVDLENKIETNKYNVQQPFEILQRFVEESEEKLETTRVTWKRAFAWHEPESITYAALKNYLEAREVYLDAVANIIIAKNEII
jgi:hypothetical protein